MLLKKKCKKAKNRLAAFHFALVLCLSLLQCVAAGTESLTQSIMPTVITSSTSSVGTRTVLRIYDECSRADSGFVPCLKKKAISFIDRISHIDAITIADGIKVVRLPDVNAAAAVAAAPWHPLNSDNELESTISRSSENHDTKLTQVLIERLSHFFNGHSLQVSFPKITSEEIGRSLEEGRGKMKKMMSMMMMGMAMKMVGMIPIAMGMLYMMAGKALIVSKIALLLAGIMGLKKMMSGRGGGNGGGNGGYSAGGGGWSSGGGGGGGGGGGWDRRSFNEAQELAYRGYDRQLQQQQQQKAEQPQKTHLQPAVPLQQQQQPVQKS